MGKRPTSGSRTRTPCISSTVLVLIGVLCVAVAIDLCYLVAGLSFLAGIRYRSRQMPESLVVIDESDPFVADRARQFDLAQVLQQYDEVTGAIERYRRDRGTYPLDLAQLVPEYLPRVPEVYIKRGEGVVYAPASECADDTTFTFYVYGHHFYGSYPGDVHMDRYELTYWPTPWGALCDRQDLTNRHSHRINDRWIWVSQPEH